MALCPEKHDARRAWRFKRGVRNCYSSSIYLVMTQRMTNRSRSMETHIAGNGNGVIFPAISFGGACHAGFGASIDR